jgi:hypothetical protein
MADRVFLHIGAPKSGTTYLQERLAHNRARLDDVGLHYLETRTGDHFQAALDLIERPWAGELKRARGQWQVLADAARRTPGDVLVSHEILAAATPAQVARAFGSLGEAEVHIVLTARDLARQLPAEWQEQVKHRSAARFQGFLDRVTAAPRIAPAMWFWRVQSVPDVLTRWATGLTPDQVHVVTVPPKGAPPDMLWRRFASVVGLDEATDPTEDAAPGERLNPSLGTAEVAVLRRLNRRLRRAGVSRQTYVPLVRDLIAKRVFAAHEDMTLAVVPEDFWPFVDEVSREWREWIEGAGVQVVGDLDDLDPRWPAPDELGQHPDRPPPGLVAQCAIEALAEVLAEIDRTGTPEDSPAKRLGRRLLGS